MKMLAIDSSAVTVSCAVTDGKEILSSALLNEGLTHSQTLMKLIDSTLSESSLAVCDIDSIAVSAGPGSFTGIRIGIATVKGIAFTRGVPCIGVSTLAAITYGSGVQNGYVAAVMDARREQVYTAMFCVKNGTVERITEDRAISISQLAGDIEGLNGDVWLCGDGAKICFEALNEKIPNLHIVPEDNLYQSGIGVARAALASGEGRGVAAEMLVPNYLRLPQAERELNNKRLTNNSQEVK